MVNRVGGEYLTSNIEGGEYSYVQEAGSKEKLVKSLGYEPKHFKLDLRFEKNGVVVLIETKQKFTDKDEAQLKEYLAEERLLHYGKKIICILANTNDDKVRVWQSSMDEQHLLKEETVLDTMEHYESLFSENNKQNDRERVLKNTYALNETLHKKDIDEKLRSQFVGTTLLYIKDVLKQKGIAQITEDTRKSLREYWSGLKESQIRSGVQDTLEELLDNSDNKALKIELLQKNVLGDQKVKKLKTIDWVEILDEILWNIYKYINTDSSEGQDILNLFFIAFNKYTGKADKNQAFTPDHITNFMCRVTGVDRTKRIFDGTCGSGSFLVQGMVLELADVTRQKATSKEKEKMRQEVVQEHIYGIEIEENAFGLSTTNMLIHGDGNSNIKKANLFESEDFFRKANPDIILMNPPYNAKPINVSTAYKCGWKADAKEDPTKGMVFLKFISDVVKKMNEERIKNKEAIKEVKVAILLPVSAAIGSSSFISEMKTALLEDNTLEAVFTLPNEIFYPGASACACCMVFTLGKPHANADGTVNKTFFGYYKEDGHKKKKSLGRIEQFDKDNNSIWKSIEEEWLSLYRNKTVKDGLSAMQVVSGKDEWLCEAYMKTDYSKLSKADFQMSINNHCSQLVRTGKFPILISKTSQVPELLFEDWRLFQIGRIFTLLNGKGITKEEIAENEGGFVAVQSGEDNNGVMGYIDLDYCIQQEYTYTTKPCLTVARSGSAGFVSFQPEGCVVGDSAKILLLPDGVATTETYLFLQTLLTANRFKYNYGRKVTEDKYLTDWLKLPIAFNEDGTPLIDDDCTYSDEGYVPDWVFMNNYIKTLPYGDSL